MGTTAEIKDWTGAVNIFNTNQLQTENKDRKSQDFTIKDKTAGIKHGDFCVDEFITHQLERTTARFGSTSRRRRRRRRRRRARQTEKQDREKQDLPAKIEVRFQPLPRLRHVPDDGQERDLPLRRRLHLALMRSGRMWPRSARKSRRPTLISLHDTEQISIALGFVSRLCFKNAIF